MKEKSKAKKIMFLALPCLMLLVFGWVWLRLEAVSPAGHSRMFISQVELTLASGRSVSEGTSHDLTVTIEHPWPRPQWWGREIIRSGANALAPYIKQPRFIRYYNEKPDQYLHFAFDGALTWTEKGQLHIFQPRRFTAGPHLYGFAFWKDGDLKVRYSLPLQELPATPEPLTFHGLYIVEGEPPLRVDKVIRARKEQLQWNRSHETGGEIASITATPFEKHFVFDIAEDDRCDITLTVSHTPRSENGRPEVMNSELEIVDGRGKVISPDQVNVRVAYLSESSTNTSTERTIRLSIKRSYATIEPLTIRGKVFIDDNTPIPFSLRLPPRPR